MSARRHPPNRLLTWQRLQRGWSYEEMTAQILGSMSRSDETDTGLSANTVRRWETGERWPEPRYRRHLVTIFGLPASDLGLLTSDELQHRPDGETVIELRRLIDVATYDGGIDRATLLRGLAALAALPGLTPLLSLASHADATGEDGSPSADAYRQVTRQHRALYWACPPRALFEPVYAHAQLGVSLMRATTGHNTTVIGSALAETALLAGRLAFFDLNQPALADRCFEVALVASREAGDHALAAGILGHMVFVPAFAGDSEAAKDTLTAAFQHTWHGVSPAVRSWLHSVGSELEVRAGNTDDARRQTALAETALAQDPATPDWMDFYNSSRLHAFAGYAALADGATAEASRRLRQCLDALSDRDGKQRSVVLADLASASIDDPDLVIDYLGQALDAVQRTWYGTGLDRIRATRARLGDSRAATALAERINDLISVGRPALSAP